LDRFLVRRKSKIQNLKWGVALVVGVMASAHLAEAGQAAKFQRVGVILHGGPLYQVVDGLREGLKELGLEEGKHLVFEIRDTKGDLKAVEQAAKNLEREKVNLLYRN
jgi:ABC-type uncharacterized transport system substrate-binding protein